MADNLATTRVIDPIITTVARGYRNAMFAWPLLFPIATVQQRGGKILAFGTEDFVKRDLERAPGARRERLNVGYKGEDYALTQRALDGVLPKERLEEAEAVPGIALGRLTARKTMSSVFLQIEVKAASLATTVGNYSADHKTALAGNAQWSHKDSMPAKAVETGKEQIADAIGLEPNVMIIGVDVYRALKNNPDVLDRIKHTTPLGEGTGSLVTVPKLASYFDVERVMVARSRSGAAGDFKPLWGKNVVLAYSNVGSLAEAEADMGEPSYGYCYRLMNYPIVEPAWLDKTCDSWLYPVTTEDTPVIAGKDAGFLFSNVVT